MLWDFKKRDVCKKIMGVTHHNRYSALRFCFPALWDKFFQKTNLAQCSNGKDTAHARPYPYHLSGATWNLRWSLSGSFPRRRMYEAQTMNLPCLFRLPGGCSDSGVERWLAFFERRLGDQQKRARISAQRIIECWSVNKRQIFSITRDATEWCFFFFFSFVCVLSKKFPTACCGIRGIHFNI